MDGSKVLGEGSFGCVLSPPVTCKGKETRMGKKKSENVATVGKIFTRKKDYDIEVKASKMALKADAEGKYILTPTSYCPTTIGDVQKLEASKECSALSDLKYYPHETSLYQIKMPYGGERFDTFVKQNQPTLRQFCSYILDVLQGISQLQKKKVVHQDIKASNLLINVSGDVIIIDYSLMLPYKEVYTEDNLRRLHHTYFPYPPEYKLFYLKHVTKSVKDGLELTYFEHEISNNFHHYGEDHWKTFESIYGPKRMKRDTNALYQYVVKRATTNKKLEKTFLPFVKKLDSYSVGMVMVHLDNYVQKQGVKHATLKEYYDVVRSLICIDPRERISVSDAMKKLKKLAK